MDVRRRSGLKGGDAKTHDVSPVIKNVQQQSERKESQVRGIRNEVMPPKGGDGKAHKIKNAVTGNG